MDFYKISVSRDDKKKIIEIGIRFLVNKNRDIMVRGGSFYAIWDEEKKQWSTDEYDVVRLIDTELRSEYEKVKNNPKFEEYDIVVNYLKNYASKAWSNYRKFIKEVPDYYIPLDNRIVFKDEEGKKELYSSRRVSYSLMDDGCSCDAYNELMSTLYNPEEREKLDWAIGAVLTGASKEIQKFMVLYGDPGSGKSTFLHIVEKLTDGYWSSFNAKSLVSNNNSFALESFKNNPLVAIQHDAILNRIEDNTMLNSIVSHETMEINEKFKSKYDARFESMLFLGVNQAVKITDAKSGLTRRMIDVSPSGRKLNRSRYDRIVKQIDFELGCIARHCIKVFNKLGEAYYDDYKPINMMYETDYFFNYIENSFDIFNEQGYTTITQAYNLYKEYCDMATVDHKMSLPRFRTELKNYFEEFEERSYVDGKVVRSLYKGFKGEKIFPKTVGVEKKRDRISENEQSNVLGSWDSLLDDILKKCPAQGCNKAGTPKIVWDKVETTLKDINTRELHWVRPPENHIVIDFDLTDDETGEKSLEKNIEASSKWPPTYTELSRSGKGVHLHYYYRGDVEKLADLYSPGIEIKKFLGKLALRRQLTKCNNLPMRTIDSGLPLKEGQKKKMIDFEGVKSEKTLRRLIEQNLRKEVHDNTKRSVDFIEKILLDAYNSGLQYDITDMRQAVMTFCAKSSNNSAYCLKCLARMKFKSNEETLLDNQEFIDSKPLVFFDVEIFPNLFIICWKAEGKNSKIVKMINPKPYEVEELFKMKLIGFNNRKFDNHIIYAASLGKIPFELYNLSQKIIKDKQGFLGPAYNISYTDVYDFASEKKSLKVWEIELELPHRECRFKWDQYVPEENWNEVADYCCNDVLATEAVFNARKGDFIARQILADLAGMTVNDTTNTLTTRIIFGTERNPKLVYTDLSEDFPGYSYEYSEVDKKYHNIYKGEDVGRGGLVRAKPGVYGNVGLFDIASQHPTSAICMNYFGDYTPRFKEMLDARIFIKHGDLVSAKKMFNGKLEKYLDNPEQAKMLAQALKIAVNSVYGLTAATFSNSFRHKDNHNNVVALRGALFMMNLKEQVENLGYIVVHIKTDSIKVADCTDELVKFIFDFGKKYGYSFEHENTYDRLALLNDAVYVAREGNLNTPIYNDKGKYIGPWTSTGTQLIHSYTFKTLFSGQEIEFKDLCETKSVKTAMYLDFNEGLSKDEHDRVFVGRTGAFCPVKEGCDGGLLVKEKGDDNNKFDSVTGALGWRWKESENVFENHQEDQIDMEYFDRLAEKAKKDISYYCDWDWFVSEEPYSKETHMIYPF